MRNHYSAFHKAGGGEKQGNSPYSSIEPETDMKKIFYVEAANFDDTWSGTNYPFIVYAKSMQEAQEKAQRRVPVGVTVDITDVEEVTVDSDGVIDLGARSFGDC